MTAVRSFKSYLLPLLTVLITGCSAASPLAISYPASTYKTEEVLRGVVNGLWKYDTAKNRARLDSMFANAGEPLATQLSSRYLVRVGVNRSLFLGHFMKVVVLPDGWTYSLDEVVDDGRTINIGDVVDVRGHVATNVESVIGIVRKCNAQPVADEDRDWNIGCGRIESFDSNGFGGKKYYLTVF